MAKVRTRKQTEAMKDELAACTFTPQLHPPPSNIAKKPYVPLQERAATLVKQKNARLDQCASLLLCFRWTFLALLLELRWPRSISSPITGPTHSCDRSVLKDT